MAYFPGMAHHGQKLHDVSNILHPLQNDPTLRQRFLNKLAKTPIGALYRQIYTHPLESADLATLRDFLTTISTEPQYAQEIENIYNGLPKEVKTELDTYNSDTVQSRQMQLGYDQWGRCARLLFYIIKYILNTNKELIPAAQKPQNQEDLLRLRMAQGQGIF